MRQSINGIGYCARMSDVGDWAFQFAFDLARRHDIQLDIFFFPTSPCEEHEARGRWGELIRMAREQQIDLEKEIRLYYDDKLGDYEKVGFRLCLGDEAPELRRCLFDHEYDILVLSYQKPLCPLGDKPIEEFARSMQCPVVLVGPNRPDEIYLNEPATLWTDEIGVGPGQWQPVPKTSEGDA